MTGADETIVKLSRSHDIIKCFICVLSVPGTILPQYSITTNGTVVTDDGSDVMPPCVLYYNDEMDKQAKAMAATVDALIGREICVNQMPGDVLIKSVFSNLQFSGNQVIIGKYEGKYLLIV